MKQNKILVEYYNIYCIRRKKGREIITVFYSQYSEYELKKLNASKIVGRLSQSLINVTVEPYSSLVMT